VVLGIGAATPTKMGAFVTGTLVVGGTAGTCTVSFAQNSSSGTGSVLATGSALRLTRV
jgi:predicted outer membrane repeat protein